MRRIRQSFTSQMKRLGVLSTSDGRGFTINPYRTAALRYNVRVPMFQAGRVAFKLAEHVPASQPVALRLTMRQVGLKKLLMGNQAGMLAKDFATATGDMMWTSTTVHAGPHLGLLQLAEDQGSRVFDLPTFANTEYGRLANNCIRLKGRFFGDATIEAVSLSSRAFVESVLAESSGFPSRQSSSPGDSVTVRPIENSDCYQVLNGHHRLARAAFLGLEDYPVSVRGAPITTALQDYLGSMTWLGGTREIYQPLPSPELASQWPLVRQCVDRLDRMRLLIDMLNIDNNSTYLDVGACYGWFVNAFQQLGFNAHGVEIDPLAPRLAHAAYGLEPGRLVTDDAVDYLRDTKNTWDIVSCFSVLHHFILGRGNSKPEDFVRQLDRATGRVLFLDTGQENEEWFAKSLQGWTPDRIRLFLLDNSTFSKVIDLGPDSDDAIPFQHNYRRHLFACIR